MYTVGPLIVKVGIFLYEKLGASRGEYIRQNMELLGRLLLQLRTMYGNLAGLETYIKSSCLDKIIEAVAVVTQKEANYVGVFSFAKPSTTGLPAC